MSTDARIEAMAIAMHCDLPDAVPPFHVWDGDTERERRKYRLSAQVGVIAADRAAILTDRDQIDALSPTARILHGGYEWTRTRRHWENVVGDERSAKDLVPARVTDWGVE